MFAFRIKHLSRPEVDRSAGSLGIRWRKTCCRGALIITAKRWKAVTKSSGYRPKLDRSDYVPRWLRSRSRWRSGKQVWKTRLECAGRLPFSGAHLGNSIDSQVIPKGRIYPLLIACSVGRQRTRFLPDPKHREHGLTPVSCSVLERSCCSVRRPF